MRNRRIVESYMQPLIDVVMGTLAATLILLLAAPKPVDLDPKEVSKRFREYVNTIRILKDSLAVFREKAAEFEPGNEVKKKPVDHVEDDGYQNPLNIVLNWTDPSCFAYLELWKDDRPLIQSPNINNGWKRWYSKVMTKRVGRPQILVFSSKYQPGAYKLMLHVSRPPVSAPCVLSGYCKIVPKGAPVRLVNFPKITAMPDQKIRRQVLGTIVVTERSVSFKPEP